MYRIRTPESTPVPFSLNALPIIIVEHTIAIKYLVKFSCPFSSNAFDRESRYNTTTQNTNLEQRLLS
jgi:hypothetical protein